MIEKIDQIRDLLIVPSVDEQPKIAINQMKILNLLVELRAEAEQCNIANVVGQSEQLKAFLDYCDEAGWIKNIEKDRIIKDYNKSL